MEHPYHPNQTLYAVSVDGPLYLKGLLARLQEQGALVTHVEDGGHVPLFFSRSWELEDVPRSRDELFAWLATCATLVCDVPTEQTTYEGDSSSGITIYYDRRAPALYRFRWHCPAYGHNERDASGRLEVIWTMTPELAAGTLEPILKTWLLDIAVDLAQPLRRLLQEHDLFAPYVGTAVGEALRHTFSARAIPAIQTDLLRTLTTPPETTGL